MSTTLPLLDDLIVAPHHTALCVKDFATAREFFVRVLGFVVEGEMERRDDVGEVVGLPGAVIRWAMLRRQSYRLELFKYIEPDGVPTPPRQCDNGYTHIALEVADVDAAYARLRGAGIATVSPPRELRGGATKAVYVRGPEDSIIELIQFLRSSPMSHRLRPTAELA
jgi:catechol 2,3-dioxygenase-like lactoylglutathione lyase family enzyme